MITMRLPSVNCSIAGRGLPTTRCHATVILASLTVSLLRTFRNPAASNNSPKSSYKESKFIVLWESCKRKFWFQQDFAEGTQQHKIISSWSITRSKMKTTILNFKATKITDCLVHDRQNYHFLSKEVSNVGLKVLVYCYIVCHILLEKTYCFQEVHSSALSIFVYFV